MGRLTLSTIRAERGTAIGDRTPAIEMLDAIAQCEMAGADDTCRDWLLGYDLRDRCALSHAAGGDAQRVRGLA